MATLTIRQLDDETKKRLRLRAAEHGWSMEQEVREILQAAVASEGGEQHWVDQVRDTFAKIGYAEDLVLPSRQIDERKPPFGDDE